MLARVVGTDPYLDIALLEAIDDLPNASGFRWQEESRSRARDAVASCSAARSGRSLSATLGRIGGTIEIEPGGLPVRVHRVLAPIFPGDAGGPVLDESGNFIGLADRRLHAGPASGASTRSARSTSGEDPGARARGPWSFAVPAQECRRAWDDLAAFGRVRRGYLGIQIAPVAEEEGGVLVLHVMPGGPAQRSGILPGDLITTFGRHFISSGKELSRSRRIRRAAPRRGAAPASWRTRDAVFDIDIDVARERPVCIAFPCRRVLKRLRPHGASRPSWARTDLAGVDPRRGEVLACRASEGSGRDVAPAFLPNRPHRRESSRRRARELGERAYDVLVGEGAAERTVAAAAQPGARVALLADAAVAQLHGEWVAARIACTGARCARSSFRRRGGEDARGRRVDVPASRRGGIERGDTVLALGGGAAATDLAGFVAAVHLRGLPAFLLPTTLLAQVDAAIGGKTGVRPSRRQEPRRCVLPAASRGLRPALLATLSPARLRAGLAEVAKAAWIGRPGAPSRSSRRTRRATRRTRHCRRSCAARSRVKARVVARDEHETTGPRATLNFGHTLGHAIETSVGRTLAPRGERSRSGWSRRCTFRSLPDAARKTCSRA